MTTSDEKIDIYYLLLGQIFRGICDEKRECLSMPFSTMGCCVICTLTNRAFPFISSSLYRDRQDTHEQTEKRSQYRTPGYTQRSPGHFSAHPPTQTEALLSDKNTIERLIIAQKKSNFTEIDTLLLELKNRHNHQKILLFSVISYIHLSSY